MNTCHQMSPRSLLIKRCCQIMKLTRWKDDGRVEGEGEINI